MGKLKQKMEEEIMGVGVTKVSGISLGVTLISSLCIGLISGVGGLDAEASTTHKMYTVKSGDTIGGIALKYNVGVSKLISLNKLNSNGSIYPGEKLKIKKKTVSSTSKTKSVSKTTKVKSTKSEIKTSSKTSTYTVKSGDTLGLIALKKGVTLSTLLSINGLKADSIIHVGQELKIKKTTAKATTTKTTTTKTTTTKDKTTKDTDKGKITTVSNSIKSTYTVQSGDSLSLIAYKTGTSLSKLLSLNGITVNSLIVPGQKLKVSGTSTTKTSTTKTSTTKTSTTKTSTTKASTTKASTYKVQSGDSLSGIAYRYGLGLSELMKMSGITSTSYPLMVGETLKVSGSASVTKAPTSTSSSQITKTGNSIGSGTVSGSEIIAEAKKYLGVPYVFGGSSMNGVDCSGLLYAVYNKVGISVPRTSALGFYSMAQKISVPQKGDLVFFKDTYKAGISHVGFVIDSNTMLDASGKETKIQSFKTTYWQSHFAGYGRIK